jgi:P2-related tail formation protein
MKKVILISLLSFGSFAQEQSLSNAKERLFEQLAILSPGSSKDDARKNLATFLNFIYDQGVKKTGLPFITSGAFMVQDDDQKMFLSLKKLVRFIADKNVADEWMCKEQLVSITDAYPRKSSHLNEWIEAVSGSKTKAVTFPCLYTHYGVDFQKGELKQAGKNHFLFGHYEVNGKNMIFIKFERAGLQGSSFFEHAWNFVKAKLDINEEESGIYRKERIPKDILQKFKESISSEDYKQYEKNAKAFGIHEIVKIAKKLSSEKANPKLETLVSDIKKRYPDYCMRMGDEVILTEEPVTCE